LGDLNLDRLKPKLKEGKILKDTEETHNLQCLIKEPTRITLNSETLLDVILTNKPELFKQLMQSETLSGHLLVYGIIAEKNSSSQTKKL
jgi:hypothetical protein